MNTEKPNTSTSPELPDDMCNAGAPSRRTWNYRVISFNRHEGAWLAIHEVHYRDGVPVMYSLGPAVILWDAEEDGDAGRRCLDRMREALDKPVLTESDFPRPTD